MTRSDPSLILLSQPRIDVEKDALQKSVQLLTQNLEDVHLSERVERALRGSGYGPLRTVKVAVHAQLVILSGRVPSYYLKQIAQETARALSRAHQVHNDLNVVRLR
jgi:osmotically-inducible protein OsmY